MQIRTFDYKNEYPIYGAKFLDNDTLLVTGGTGTSNPDIGNKVTAFKVNFKRKTKKIKKFRELILPSDYNYPTSLDTDGLTIVLGFNEEIFNEDEYSDFPEFSNLRKYTWNNEHLIFDKPVELFDPMERTLSFVSLCYISEDGSVAAVSSSNAKSPKLVIFDPKDLSIKFKINASNNEMISDMHFSSDNKVLCYVTESTFEAISTITGRSLLKNNDLKKKYGVNALTHIRFISSDDILIAVSFADGKSVGLVLYSISKLKILKVQKISNKFKKITSLDFCPLFNPHTNQVDYGNSLIAVSGNDNSVTIFKYKNFQRVAYFPSTQPFITKISFSPSGEYLVAVTSEGNIRLYRIHTLDLFNDSGSKFLKTVFYSFACIIFVGFIGVVTQYMINKNVFEKLIDQIKKNRADSSSYFKFNDIIEDKTSIRIHQAGPGSPKSIVEEIVYDEMMSKSTMVINRDPSKRKRSVLEVIPSSSTSIEAIDSFTSSHQKAIPSDIAYEVICEESVLSSYIESSMEPTITGVSMFAGHISENTLIDTINEEDQIYSILPIDATVSEDQNLRTLSISENNEENYSILSSDAAESEGQIFSILPADAVESEEQIFSILPIDLTENDPSNDFPVSDVDKEKQKSTEIEEFFISDETPKANLEILEEPIHMGINYAPYGGQSVVDGSMDNEPKLANDAKLERLERIARIEQLKLELEELEFKKKQLEEAEKKRLEQERLEQEKLAKIEQERLEERRLEQERLEQERLEQERLEQERLEQEKLAKIEEERLEQERLEQERLEQERLEQERLEQEKLAKIEQERLEEKRLEQERLEQERLEQERLEQEKLAKIEEERLEQERLEQERLEQERLEQERLEQEKLAKIEQERLEEKRLEQERLEQERLEQERLEQERLEQERLEQERLEQERLEQERLEQERLEQERLEQERLEQERLEQERLEQERLEQERLEQERLEQERLEQERLEQERLEQERLEQERLEQERLEQERLEQERLEQERLEQERLAKIEEERLEQERLAKIEEERLEQERLEQERLEQERLEQERLAKIEEERLEQEKLAKIEEERLEQERLEQERLAKIEEERFEQEKLAKIEEERLEQERLEQERLAKIEEERFEHERFEHERLELEQEKLEQELVAKIEQEKFEQQRVEQERVAKLEERRWEDEEKIRYDKEEKKLLAKLKEENLAKEAEKMEFEEPETEHLRAEAPIQDEL